MAPTASLDALPNEILYEILKYLTKKTDAAIPRRYQICNTFACLNRRLRQFALPHVFNEIRVPNYKRLPNMIDQFKEHLSLIRSIRVGHGPLRKSEAGLSEECLWPLSLLPEAERIAQLCNLTNFDCLGFCFDPDVLEVTFGTVNTRLQSFRLGWDDGSAFPFEAFPSLESLHIYVIPHSFNGSERQLCASQSPSLTALSVIDADAAWFEQNICGRVTFPNLRVLNILPSGFSYDAILIFISEHPTLTAVNIPRIYIPFPEFVTLVKGERHSTRSDDSGIRTRAPPDDPAFHEWSEVELASFAFVCESEKRPQSPSRIVTELSIESSYEGGPCFYQL
ncbi:hypothetical protein B0H10DRAFT_423815 [Mycena sp. CBHHK59/15]|nr:hypothetical protein B0H10DRAFT_423815 [Mycena sp. CBHHK59/15]